MCVPALWEPRAASGEGRLDETLNERVAGGCPLAYGSLWPALPLSTLFLHLPMPRQPTQEATDFWAAIEATWVPMVAVHLLLMWRARSAYARLWSSEVVAS